eukprot:3221233-Pleurochrysis_carterae.AAC.1
MYTPGRERALGFVTGREARANRLAYSGDGTNRRARGSKRVEHTEDVSFVNTDEKKDKLSNDVVMTLSQTQQTLEAVLGALRDINTRLDVLVRNSMQSENKDDVSVIQNTCEEKGVDLNETTGEEFALDENPEIYTDGSGEDNVNEIGACGDTSMFASETASDAHPALENDNSFVVQKL